MDGITSIFSFLLAHPILIAVLAVLAVVFIIILINKIIKAAKNAFIIFIIAGGAIIHTAGQAVENRGKEIIRELQEDIPNP